MILLDTHIVVWLLLDPARLSDRAHDRILQARVDQEPLGYSLISAFEIVDAAGRAHLPLGASAGLVRAIERRLAAIPLTSTIAQCAAMLPDPFRGDSTDRIIAATAIVEDCLLITSDERIREANVCKTIW